MLIVNIMFKNHYYQTAETQHLNYSKVQQQLTGWSVEYGVSLILNAKVQF